MCYDTSVNANLRASAKIMSTLPDVCQALNEAYFNWPFQYLPNTSWHGTGTRIAHSSGFRYSQSA